MFSNPLHRCNDIEEWGDLADSVLLSATSSQYVCANFKGHSVHLRQRSKVVNIQNAFLIRGLKLDRIDRLARTINFHVLYI